MKLQVNGSNRTTVTLANGTEVFFSYSTPVAAHIPGRGYVQTEKYWGRTTSKHIGQFGATGGAVEPQSFFDNLGATV